MIFKNAIVLAFTKPFDITIEELNEQLSENPFRPLGKTEMSNIGWVNPLSCVDNDYYLAASNGHILLKLYKETKDIKVSTIKKKLDQAESQMVLDQGRGLTKQEKEQIKEDTIFSLLPHAQTTEKATYGYISPRLNMMVINSATDSDVETFCALLRKSLGSLPVTRIHVESEVDEIFTNWLIGEDDLPPKLEIGFGCVLQSIGEDKSTATLKNQDLAGEEVKTHIDNGKYVTELDITHSNEHEEQIFSCTITENLTIKKIKYSDLIKEQNEDLDSEDVLALLEANFILNVGVLNTFLQGIHDYFKINIVDYLDDKELIKTLRKCSRTFKTDVSLTDQLPDEEITLIASATAFCLEEKRISISGIHRKFKIGFNRAHRIAEAIKTQGLF